jgi:hypothetical protein
MEEYMIDLVSLTLAIGRDLNTLDIEHPNFMKLVQATHPIFALVYFNKKIPAVHSADGFFVEVIFKGQFIRIIGINDSLPDDVINSCVIQSKNPYFGENFIDEVLKHQSHIIVTFAKTTLSVLEQYITLTAFTAAFISLGAIAVINEKAGTSLPAQHLLPKNVDGDLMHYLENIPIPLFYCGTNSYQSESSEILVTETTGMSLFGYPDFAVESSINEPFDGVLILLHDLITYYVTTNSTIKIGDTGEHEGQLFQIFTPNPDTESFLIHQNSETVLFLFKQISDRI